MLKPMTGSVIAVLVSLSMTGCNIYDRLGEGADAVAMRFIDPQLFWVDGKGQVTCYDKHRQWPGEPLALSYPVPCLDTEWQ